MSLYTRLTTTTKSDPKGVPKPYFSLPSTINWMHALRVIVEQHGYDASHAREFYAKIQPKKMTSQEENSIFEQLLFSIHQCSALSELRQMPNKSDASRIGILAWYYGIYSAASAMVLAKDGSFQEDHTGTANAFGHQITTNGLLVPPFDAHIKTLVKKDAESELSARWDGPKFALTGRAPENEEEALGACNGYLSGSVTWYEKKNKEDLKSTSEFRDLGVPDFRTNKAKELANKRLSKRQVNFLHLASRYRGKANYREALYLGYGDRTNDHLENYIEDLSVVLNVFVIYAGIFCARRLGKDLWNDFVEDLEENRAFTLSPKQLWQ